MLVRSFLESVERSPNKLAVQDSSRKLTYRQLKRLAQAIRRIVCHHTDCPRVGVMLPGTAGGVATLYGVLWAGRIGVPLNFLLKPNELKQVVERAEIDLIISTIHFRELLSDLPVKTIYLEELNLRRSYLWQCVCPTPALPSVADDDTAIMLFTSGTTGSPKGVCLTQNNLYSNSLAAIEHLQLKEDCRLLGIIPSFHVFGLTVLHFLPMILGATVTFIPRFSPQATHRAIRQDKINVILGVPSMFNAISRLKSIDPSHFADIRIAASGGEPLPDSVYERVKKRTGMTLIEGYGLTETSPILSADVPWDHHHGTVGKAVKGVEIQLRDAMGTVVVGNEGELFVRGPMIMKEYYKDPEQTAQVIDSEGWFSTGDIVRVEEGYISITGRAKDLIIVGGENVYPREVEQVLERYPGVAEVAVIGLPDASRGEVVVAFVTPEADQTLNDEAMRNFCREHLASFKIPRQIHVRLDLPRGPTGKILKRLLKEDRAKGSS